MRTNYLGQEEEEQQVRNILKVRDFFLADCRDEISANVALHVNLGLEEGRLEVILRLVVLLVPRLQKKPRGLEEPHVAGDVVHDSESEKSSIVMSS